MGRMYPRPLLHLEHLAVLIRITLVPHSQLSLQVEVLIIDKKTAEKMNSQGAKGAVGGLLPMPARKEAESLWEANGGWEPEPPLHPHHLLVPLGQLHQYLLLSNLAALPYHLLLLPPPRR